MTNALDWEFIKEFHPLPPSDRRVLLKSLAIEGIDIFDEAQFYDWLAGFYREGRATEIDAVISRKLSKADERALIPVLFTWLISCTGSARRRRYDKLSMIKSMAKAVIAKGGTDAERLRLLAPNYPSLELLPPSAELASLPEASNIGARLAASAHPEESTQAHAIESGLAEPEVTLARVVEAVGKLRENPSAKLLELAWAFADAVDTHVSMAALTLREAADLEQRRFALDSKLASLDTAIAARVGTPLIDRLSRQAIDLIEASLIAVSEAVHASTLAREKMVASLDATPAERENALSVFNASIFTRDETVAALAVAIEQGKTDTSPEAPRDNPSLPAIGPLLEVEPHSADAEKCDQPSDSELITGSEPELYRENAEASESGNTGAVSGEVEDIVFDETENEKMVLEAGTLLEDGPAYLGETPSSEAAHDGEPYVPDTAIAQLPSWDAWIATALRVGRLALAVHLADGQDLAGANQIDSYSSAALEGLLRGNAVQAVYSRGWADYEGLKDRLLQAAASTGPSKASNDLLLFAGAIRPAIVQSQTALALLQALEGDIAANLQALRSVLEDVAGQRIDNLAQVAASPDQTEKQARVAELLRQIAEWQSTAPTRRMNYQPATAVWLELIDEGPLGQAANLILKGAPNAAIQVGEIIGHLESDIDGVIDSARAKLSKGVHRVPIEGNARKHLHGQILAALDLFGAWAGAQKQLLSPGEDRLRASRGQLLVGLAAARERISRLGEGDDQIAAAVEVFQSIVLGIEAQLTGAIAKNPYADEALDWEICLLPEFDYNARTGFRVTPEDVEDLAAAADAAFTTDLLSPDQAFDEALRLDAASSGRRLIEHLSPSRRVSAEAALDETILAARKRLGDRVRAVRQLLDDVQIATTGQSGELDELERAMTSFEQLDISDLPRDVGDLQTVADFPIAHRELDRIQRLLDKARAPVRAALVSRIEALEVRFGTFLEDCRDQLDCDDLGTLSEEIEQIEKHGPTGPVGPTALGLLKQFTSVLDVFGDRPSIDWGNLTKCIREGGRLGPLEYGGLKPFDRDRAGELIRSYVELRRTFAAPVRKSDKQADPAARVAKEAVKLLEALGWASVRVQQGKREASWYQFSMSSVAFGDRDICPVPVFGSERLRSSDRRAHYPLVVVDPDGAEACVTALDTLPDKVLLIFTSALDYRLRRDILRKTRRGTRSVAVADGVTIAMLAATPERGLRQFFELAIPMGGAQPYTDTGAETAIENFFGRQQEINNLVDPNGPSFVYGGRQLGKTALLKQIELRESGSEDRIAVYCYIKAIGESESPDAVWDEIYNKMRARGVHLPSRGATIADKLKAWVDEKAGRFLLIMLDEADAFLASEMEQNFPQIGQMKQLMESTKRGVKFVFAGLHNVHRFYRAPNSPLLHWGAPVNVGPLLGSDRLAARQMALEPMAALGFAFERTIDAYHMLSLVGFYPSLMQSFGKAVVGAMNSRAVSKGEPSSLPAVITRSLIESCFEDKTFRDSVTYRFQETLKLDERYELITYAVWDKMQDDSRGGRATAFGYSASDISRSARSWWPAGFTETESLESFTAILDEMVEMGVLARKSDHYALRSQRIAAMLGTKADIGNRLQNLIERTPRRRPDPLVSHRRIGKRWSALTLRQEAALHTTLKAQSGPRIVLVSAAPAAGLASMRASIDALLTGPSVDWRSPRHLLSSQPQHIVDAAAILRSSASPEAPGIVLAEGEWPDVEALQALRKDRTLRESQRPVRVILCGLPKPRVLCALGSMHDILHIQVGPLPVEAMLHWMNREQIGFADDETVQVRLRTASGGYLEALEAVQVDGQAKRTPDVLILAVEAAASGITLEQIGLDFALQTFARDLVQVIGSEPVLAPEVDVWADEVGGDAGRDHLRQLAVLGVIETASIAGETQNLVFNPLAARLLT